MILTIIQNNKFRNLIPILIILIFLIIFPLIFNNSYVKHVMIMIFIYAIAGESWNILGGYVGQVSLGHAIFFGVGAYTSSILLLNFNINPWIGMLVGGCFAVILAFIIGMLVFRLLGHFFAIATLSLGFIMYVVFLNLEYTKGAIGIELPLVEESIKNMSFTINKNGFYYISLACLILVVFVVYIIIKSKLGYYFKTIKGDEDMARSIGINTTFYKSIALSISVFIAAMAGTLYAQYFLYIDPDMVFGVILSIQFVIIVALGGAGTILGPILGSFIIIPIIEITRIFFGGGGRGLDVLLYGILIILIALFRPEGLITLFAPKK